ncbi:MAG TPA: hypothetical protein VN598_10090 [Usitatibacter sp.]|nr:hypothetical protein [Usitatibacter sp.]
MNDDPKKPQEERKPPKPSGQQQQQGGEGPQYGEGNYKATRQYNEGVKDHMQHHDVEKEARDAAPRSDAEARDMERAEEEGRSRAKGDSGDKPEDPAQR